MKEKNKCSYCGSTKSVYFYLDNLYCARHVMQLKRHGKISERTKFDPNEFIFHETYVEICLYNRNHDIVEKTKIDIDDFHKCKEIKWKIKNSGSKKSGKKYCHSSDNSILLHHYVLNFARKEGLEIDHINGDGLDNRKSNLRVVTRKENMMNQRKLPSNNTSGYIGVTFNKKTGKWDAQMKLDGKHIYLGSFTNIEDAVSSRKEAELKYFGENKTINFE